MSDRMSAFRPYKKRKASRAMTVREGIEARRRKAASYKRFTRVQRGTNGVLALTRPPRSLTPSFGGPFGQIFETELNYAEYFSMNPTIGGTTSTLFLANGLYDPYVPLTGHQPHGFDQLNVMYENWQVLSSTIEIVMYPQIEPSAIVNGTGSVNLQLVGSFMSIAVRDKETSLTGALTTLTDILERPNIKTKFVNSNDTPTAIRHSFSMPQFYGRTRGLDDGDITGTANSDPTDKVYYHVIFGANNGSYDLSSHQFVARIKYKCRFFNPKNLVQST